MSTIKPRRVNARSPRHFAKRREPLRDTRLIPKSCPLATSHSLIERYKSHQECPALGGKYDEPATFEGTCSAHTPLIEATSLIQTP